MLGTAKSEQPGAAETKTSDNTSKLIDGLRGFLAMVMSQASHEREIRSSFFTLRHRELAGCEGGEVWAEFAACVSSANPFQFLDEI